MKVIATINAVSIVIAFVTAIVLAFTNSGSRNIVLATGTLAAAMLLFVLQLPFELRRSVTYDHVSTEFTVDRAKPGIRQWIYSSDAQSTTWRLPAETAASAWLTGANVAAFQGDRDKLTTDLAIFSLLSFFTSSEFDWQLRRVIYKGKSSGTVMTWQAVSKDSECAKVAPSDLAAKLTAARNLFAGAHIGGSARWCLPPKTGVDVTPHGVVLRNPAFQVTFRVDLSGNVSYMQPNTGGAVPTLPNGEAQFETRWVGITIETLYFALRSQHRDAPRYREWVTRIIGGTRDWFES